MRKPHKAVRVFYVGCMLAVPVLVLVGNWLVGRTMFSTASSVPVVESSQISGPSSNFFWAVPDNLVIVYLHEPSNPAGTDTHNQQIRSALSEIGKQYQILSTNTTMTTVYTTGYDRVVVPDTLILVVKPK